MKLTKLASIFKATAKSAIIITTGFAASAAHADTFTFTVDTIQPVSITERQALFFGSELKLAPSASCAFTALTDAEGWLATDTSFATLPAAAAPVAVSGTGCADTTSTTSLLGHYLISGAASTPIKVKLVSGGDADGKITFEPQGIVDNVADGSTLSTVLTKDTQGSITLDTSGNAGLLVGGEIILGIDGLEAGTSLTATFDIEVTY